MQNDTKRQEYYQALIGKNKEIEAGYESSSEFRDTFSKIMGAPPVKAHQKINILKALN